MKSIILFSAAAACLIISGCVSMAPVSNTFESARTLDKGQAELMGNYSMAYFSWEDEEGAKQTDQTNNNIGLRIGYGVVNRFDIKMRYERLMPVTEEDKAMINGANFIGLGPRYAIVKDRLTGGIDFGFYWYRVKETEDSDPYNDSMFAISPKLAFTVPANRNFDVTLGTKLDLFTSDDVNLWHVNLGFGFSSDASKWALRPEIGIIKDLDNFSDYTWYSAGVALIIRFNPAEE